MSFKISVVIPAYNCEKNIIQAISSIFNQDIKDPVELIIEITKVSKIIIHDSSRLIYQ